MGFLYSIEFAVEKARDKVHAMSGDQKTKEIMHSIYSIGVGYIGHLIASPVMFVMKTIDTGWRKVRSIGKSVSASLGVAKVVEGGVEVKQAEPVWMKGILIWCP